MDWPDRVAVRAMMACHVAIVAQSHACSNDLVLLAARTVNAEHMLGMEQLANATFEKPDPEHPAQHFVQVLRASDSCVIAAPTVLRRQPCCGLDPSKIWPRSAVQNSRNAACPPRRPRSLHLLAMTAIVTRRPRRASGPRSPAHSGDAACCPRRRIPRRDDAWPTQLRCKSNMPR